MSRPPTAIINYSHDSVHHKKRVLQFGNKLIDDGIDVFLDQYETSPPEGWQQWMEGHICNDDFVLIVCTQNYLEKIMNRDSDNGKGVKWEGNLIYQYLYNSGTQNSKFIPVLFNDSSQSSIPMPIRGATRYCIETEEGYQDLYRHLTNQPKYVKPSLGQIKYLPPEDIDSYIPTTIKPERSFDAICNKERSSHHVESVDCAYCQGTGKDRTPFALGGNCPVCKGASEKKIELPKNSTLAKCAFCQGIGKDRNPFALDRICPVCKGIGMNVIQKTAKTCRICGGTGEDRNPFALGICPVCKGTGFK